VLADYSLLIKRYRYQLIIKKEKMTNQSNITLNVVISGAGGAIGYSLLPLIASGYIFQDRPIELRLLEIPQAIQSLEGTRMELEDCAYPNLVNVVCTTDPLVAFDNADVCILVGGFPRRKGMARKDLIQKNTSIFTSMGRAINNVASSDCKVLVVANPANTNCLVALKEASNISTRNFCALTYLDHQRAKSQIATHIGCAVRSDQIHNVTIWGNHSETQYPDALTDGYCLNDNGIKTPLHTLLSSEWANNDFVTTVQNRGKSVIEARGASSALSAAMAIANCLKVWLVTGTKEDETISLAVYNDKGYYGVESGIVFSFPCTCHNGEWKVKGGLELSEFARQKLMVTEKELLEEWEAAKELVDNNTSSMKTSISNVSSMPSLIESESGVSLASKM